MALALIVFLIAAWALMPILGNHGLGSRCSFFVGARGLWLGLFYWRLERGGPGSRRRSSRAAAVGPAGRGLSLRPWRRSQDSDCGSR